MTGWRLAGAALTVAGAGGVTVCLASLSVGMRDVMQTDGGFCASGGPYVTANPCSAGDIRMVTVGMMGGLVAGAVYVAGTRGLGRPASSAGLLTWTALFGALGWNFISLGLHPAAHQGVASGWLFTGGMFWVMALSGLVPFLVGLFGELRRAGRADPVVARVRPLVRSAVLPGVPSWPSGGPRDWQPYSAPWPGGATAVTARGAGGLAWSFSWLVGSLAGIGLGLALISSLLGALR